MEFTCLWSKDAQQKKRKRWTDGIVRFSPSAGLLSVWDQDGVKISSTRLKPDEAAVALRDDVDETRVGGISIQIVACVGPEEQHRHTAPVDTAGVAAAHNRKPLSTAGEAYPDDGRGDPGEVLACSNGARTVRSLSPDYGSRSTPNAVAPGGKSKPASGQASGFKRATLGARRSLPSGAFARNQVSMIEPTNVEDQTTSVGDGDRDDGSDGNDFGPVLKRRAIKRSVPNLTPRALGGPKNRIDASRRSSAEESGCVHATAEVSRPDPSKRNELGSVSKVGLRGGRMGAAGGARRFHAPRSTGTAPAKQGLGQEASVPLVASGGFSTFAPGIQTKEQRVGVSRGDTVAADVNDVELSLVATSSAAGKLDPATNQEDLVLEWMAGNPPQPLKAGGSLTRRLHPHQRDGLKVLWQCLAGRGNYNGRGAILADEMGLGKTATAIALCTCMLRHRRAECRKAVVVCPSSLVKNWANEFRKWCPLGGGAVAVDQAGAAAAQMVADFNIGAPARYPILVISYELYRNHGSVINATEGLGLLIADEGHRLKNSAETKTTRALKACPAAMRLVMTGTPMQNDLDEFFAMADFVNPGLLGSLKSFRSKYTRPITAAWDREAAEDVKELAAERARELGEVCPREALSTIDVVMEKPFEPDFAVIVFNLTKDVIQGSLPPALEIVVFCRISQRQLSLYERWIAESGTRAAFFGDDGAAPGTPLRASFREVLPLISTLRRLCNHPDLVVENSGGGGLIGAKKFDDGHLREKLPNQAMDGGNNDEDSDSDSDDLAFLLMGMKEGEERGRAQSQEKENTQANGIDVGRGGGPGPKRSWEWPPPMKTGAGAKAGAGIGRGVDKATDTTRGFARGTAVTAARYATEDSGKLVVLEALLRSIRQEFPGDKVVVTSNFTSALDVLVCLAERNGWGFQRLDGGTASNARQPLVDDFNRAPSGDLFLFFLSARAGGVGLNLIGANRIVLYDSDWNPATDDQAMARVWRLGQTKEVSMYRLFSTGTLEETIYQRQIFKGSLYDLIHDANDPGSAPNFTASMDGDGSGRRKASQRNRQISDGCGQVGGGFSQEELKDLFVLKTETSSDTFDKLRRRIPLLRDGDDAHEQLSSPEFDRHDDGSTNRKGWREYNGPSGIADLALRRALHRESPGFGDDCDGMRGVSASAAASGPVVTFVREVKRGGVELETTRRKNVGRRTPLPGAVQSVSNSCRAENGGKTIHERESE